MWFLAGPQGIYICNPQLNDIVTLLSWKVKRVKRKLWGIDWSTRQYNQVRWGSPGSKQSLPGTKYNLPPSWAASGSILCCLRQVYTPPFVNTGRKLPKRSAFPALYKGLNLRPTNSVATPSLCVLFIDLEQFPLGSVLVVMTRKLLQGLSDHQSIGLVEFRDGGERRHMSPLSCQGDVSSSCKRNGS